MVTQMRVQMMTVPLPWKIFKLWHKDSKIEEENWQFQVSSTGLEKKHYLYHQLSSIFLVLLFYKYNCLAGSHPSYNATKKNNHGYICVYIFPFFLCFYEQI